MRQSDFEQHLAMLLRDLPMGTVATLDAGVVAYWDGQEIVYAFLAEDGCGAVDDEFDLNDFLWQQFDPQFTAWAAKPAFTERPEVREWLKDAPPREAG